MYMEFLFVIYDYFAILKKRILLFEWGIPSITGVVCLILSLGFGIDSQYGIIEKSFGYVGTLLGFTLAALTLLLSCEKMKEACEYQLETLLHNRKATLYELVVVSYTYLIVVEGILCISFFIAQLFDFVYIRNIAIIMNTAYIVLLFNVLLVTIRTVADMYFILIKRK